MFALFPAHVPVIYVTRPAEDWCAVIAKALGGDIVMFEPGRYLGGCDIEARVADKKGERTILQSFTPDELAIFEAPEGRSATLSVRGERLVVLELAFEGGTADQAHIEVEGLLELTVRRTRMGGDVGAGVRQVGATGAVTIDRASFVGIPAALELDCCPVGPVQIDRTSVQEGTVVVGDAPGTVWDSTVIGAPGPALTWGTEALELHGAFLAGEVGAVVRGPAQVDTSFLIGSEASLQADPTQSVAVLGSTLIGPVSGEPALTSCATGEGAPGGSGTIACSDPAVCWVDAGAFDFTPVPEGPLAGAGVSAAGLEVDWCGTSRRQPPTAGALEAAAPSPGPLGPQVRGEVPCAPFEGGTPTGVETASDTGSPPTDANEPPPKRCGCAAPAPRDRALGLGALAWLSLLGLASRLRRGRGAASRSR